MCERRVGERVGERSVVGQEQQPFAVVVETAGGVDALHRHELREAGVFGFGAELREEAVGLPEREDSRRPAAAHGSLRRPLPYREGE